jgi:lipoate-protein ligase A
MHFLGYTLPTLAENLALDEALLLEAESGSGTEVLRLWEWPTPTVVLGAGCCLARDVLEARCQADGVPILRRSSGGGAVLLDRGCLIYSLVLSMTQRPPLHEITPSYLYILNRLSKSLSDLVPGLAPAGTSDLAVQTRKVSGNSQHRKRTYLLHHGTLLYDFNAEQVGNYLNLPERRPAYREDRTHADFLMNVPATVEELLRRLRGTWEAWEERHDRPEALVRQLVVEKYTNAEWIRRR